MCDLKESHVSLRVPDLQEPPEEKDLPAAIFNCTLYNPLDVTLKGQLGVLTTYPEVMKKGTPKAPLFE